MLYCPLNQHCLAICPWNISGNHSIIIILSHLLSVHTHQAVYDNNIYVIDAPLIFFWGPKNKNTNSNNNNNNHDNVDDADVTESSPGLDDE